MTSLLAILDAGLISSKDYLKMSKVKFISFDYTWEEKVPLKFIDVIKGPDLKIGLKGLLLLGNFEVTPDIHYQKFKDDLMLETKGDESILISKMASDRYAICHFIAMGNIVNAVSLSASYTFINTSHLESIKDSAIEIEHSLQNMNFNEESKEDAVNYLKFLSSQFKKHNIKI